MQKQAKLLFKRYTWIAPTLLFVGSLILLILSNIRYTQLAADLKETTEELATTTAFYTERVADLEGELEKLTGIKLDLEDELTAEQNRNSEFEEQIGELASTVGLLDKLSKTDEELLQKYSKVYFLNEHYVPSDLTELEKKHAYDESRTFRLHSKVVPYFEEMIEDANEDGIDLWVVSAYRSYDEQSQLKSRYTVTYGSGANAFSADQGYSEHQLGTTVDFTTRGLGGGLNGFETTEAYTWLIDNAHNYGFVLSYPENNLYYVYEPWHWRFVGVELASDLQKDNVHFYDKGQREIDQYLINIFD